MSTIHRFHNSNVCKAHKERTAIRSRSLNQERKVYASAWPRIGARGNEDLVRLAGINPMSQPICEHRFS